MSALRAISSFLASNATKLLLIFVPLGIFGGAIRLDTAVVFVLNFLAIMSLAPLLSSSTKMLSYNVGCHFGGNISSPPLHGALDPTHITNLHLEYGSLPNPWSFVCETIAVSIVLATTSLVSAFTRRSGKDDDDDNRRSISFSTVLMTVGLLWTTIRAITTLVSNRIEEIGIS
jgi:hypothetical protein